MVVASDTAAVAHQAHLECRYRFSRPGILEMKRPFGRISRTDFFDWIACSFGWGVPVSECGEHSYPLRIIISSVFSPFIELMFLLYPRIPAQAVTGTVMVSKRYPPSSAGVWGWVVISEISVRSSITENATSSTLLTTLLLLKERLITYNYTPFYDKSQYLSFGLKKGRIVV